MNIHVSEDSEVYNDIIKLEVNNNNIYELYYKLIKKKNIKLKILKKRLINLYKYLSINLQLTNVNSQILELIIETEKILKINPIGRKWENFNINVEQYIFNKFKNDFFKNYDYQYKYNVIAKNYHMKQIYKEDNTNNHLIKLINQYKKADSIYYRKYENIVFNPFFLISNSIYFTDFDINNLKNFNINNINIKFKLKSISSNNIKDITKTFNTSNFFYMFQLKNNNEVEIRFQKITGTEFGNVFLKLLNDSDFFYINNNSIITRYSENNKTYRQYIFNEKIKIPFNQEKITVNTYFNKYWNFKVVNSIENNLNYDITKKNINNQNKLFKNTFRFYTKNKNHPLYFFETSLSLENIIDTKNIQYFIELEKRNNFKYTEVVINNAILYILKLIQNVKDENKLITKATNEEIKLILKKEPRFLINHVVPLKLKYKDVMNFLKYENYITPKYDGTRVILFIKNDIGVVIIGLDGTTTQILKPFELENELKIFEIFDCELYKNTIHVFDIILNNNLSFKNRLILIIKYEVFLQEIFKHIDDYKLKIKQYSVMNTLEDLITYYNDIFKYKHLDGIIIQPNDECYYKSNPIKIKLKYMNTLDITVEPIEFYYNNKYFKEPELSKINKSLDKTCKYLTYINFNLSLFIVEVFKINNTYYPIRVRFAKNWGNKEDVLKSNNELIDNPINIDFFNGNGVILARKLINNIKRNIINEYSPKILFDVGSGQGGDINKWNNIKYVYAVERDDQMIKIFKERQIKSNINIIHCDFRDFNLNNIKKDHINNINLMTIFFSINTIFESIESIDNFIKKIIQINPINIVILYHDYELLKKIKSDNLKIEPYKNNGYIISLMNTYVMNVIEYPFDSNIFVSKLKHYENKITLPDLNCNINNLSTFEREWISSIKMITLNKPKSCVEDDDFDYVFEDQNQVDQMTKEVKDIDIDDSNKSIQEELISDLIENEDDEIASIDENKLNLKTLKDKFNKLNNENIDDYDEIIINNEYNNLTEQFNSDDESIKEHKTIIYKIIIDKSSNITYSINELLLLWPDENVNLVINLDHVYKSRVFIESSKYLYQLLSLFNNNYLYDFPIVSKYKYLDIFLFQNFIKYDLKFVNNYTLLEVFENETLLNNTPAEDSIFIGFYEDIPINWKNTCYILINKISETLLKQISCFTYITVHYTDYIPGVIYECNNFKNFNELMYINLVDKTLKILDQKPINMTNDYIRLSNLITFTNIKFDKKTSIMNKYILHILINSNVKQYIDNNSNVYKIDLEKKILINDFWLDLLRKTIKNIITINHGIFRPNVIDTNVKLLTIYNKNKLIKDEDLYKNDATGNCLYESIVEGIKLQDETFNLTHEDLRKKTIDFIIDIVNDESKLVELFTTKLQRIQTLKQLNNFKNLNVYKDSNINIIQDVIVNFISLVTNYNIYIFTNENIIKIDSLYEYKTTSDKSINLYLNNEHYNLIKSKPFIIKLKQLMEDKNIYNYNQFYKYKSVLLNELWLTQVKFNFKLIAYISNNVCYIKKYNMYFKINNDSIEKIDEYNYIENINYLSLAIYNNI